jgi:predicted RNase H-like HicB family nuclease
MTRAKEAYLALERLMMEADDAGDDFGGHIHDIIEPFWERMTPAEKAELRARGRGGTKKVPFPTPSWLRTLAPHDRPGVAAALLKSPYHRVLVPGEDGGFSASIAEFPGCFAQGNTLYEAYENLERAAQAWLEAAIAQDYPIPEPAT